MRTRVTRALGAAAAAGALVSLGPAGATPRPRPAGPVTAYVTNVDWGVYPISTATNTALKAIKIAGGGGNIAITPDGKTAYVVSTGSSEVGCTLPACSVSSPATARAASGPR
ncbi:MAG: hypothetical protein ACLP52_28705 [Streptosporangiaceae bacterium]